MNVKNEQYSSLNASLDSNNTYSTDEKIIGKWIDGKIIYRKTIVFGSLPNSTNKRINHNINNIETIVRTFGTGINKSNGDHYPLPYVSSANSSIMISSTLTEIITTTWADRTSITAYITIDYTKK